MTDQSASFPYIYILFSIYGYTGRMVGIAEGSVHFAPSGPSGPFQRFLRGLRPLVSVGLLFSGAYAYAGEIAGP